MIFFDRSSVKVGAKEGMSLTHDERHFLLRRLHSLTGIVPIGGFLLFHFFENASARRGAEAFNATVVKISETPYLVALEMSLLILPILFHSIYGLFITASSRPNLQAYPEGRNWAYFFQRLSGLVGFFYIAFHVVTTRVWSAFYKQAPITFADMQLMLGEPLFMAVYILGIVAITYHFANGLWSFSITWGLVTSRLAQQRLACLTQVFFVILCVVGLDIVSAFKVENGFLAAIARALFG